LFINNRVQPYLAAEEALDLIHQMGGLTYIPHPLDRHRANFRPERMAELASRIDIIETYNPWCDAAANSAAARLAEDLGKVAATGSDSHSADELGRSWMELEEYSDTDDFLEKLRFARHVVTASSGTGRRA
jgi:predicted metal-dependent phosphoesterase TrpH